MGFLDKVKELFQDKDEMRNNVCAHLQKLGIDAEMAERGRAEEVINSRSDRELLGMIDIPEGPIRWVNVRKWHKWPTGSMGSRNVSDYFLNYGVPDARLGLEANAPKARMKAVRRREVPVFGEVVDVHWKGKDCGLGIIDRLNNDVLLKDSIISGPDVEISAHGRYNCWIMATSVGTTGDPPTRELWDCYQRIAQHLLGEEPTPAYLARGIAYFDLGDYQRAIEDYDEAIRLDPQDAVAYYNRGNAYFLQDQHQRAIEYFDHAIRLDPQYAAACISPQTTLAPSMARRCAVAFPIPLAAPVMIAVLPSNLFMAPP
jgi:tetratricopeptide (TPR) repeat protein